MLSHRCRLRTTLIALCAVLLAQWSLATHACPAYAAAGRASQAPEAVATETSAVAPHSCADEAAEAAICLKHCFTDEQAANPAQLAAAPPSVWMWRVFTHEPGLPHALRAHALPPRASGPPLNILYCVSLT
jgi:hypothetical protein